VPIRGVDVQLIRDAVEQKPTESKSRASVALAAKFERELIYQATEEHRIPFPLIHDFGKFRTRDLFMAHLTNRCLDMHIRYVLRLGQLCIGICGPQI